MHCFAKISPSIKLTTRLSCNTNIRRYTSLVPVQQRQRSDVNLLCNTLPVRRLYATNGRDAESRGFIKSFQNDFLNTNRENSSSSILPIALIDLNPLGNKSCKVLLIPLNWHDADEHSMRHTITSIFSKSKNLKQIEAFSQALKDIPTYQKDKRNAVKQDSKIHKNSETKNLKEELNFKDTQLSQNKNVSKSCSASTVHNLERLAAEVEKSLQQCCLHSMQIFVDDRIFGERIRGLKFLPLPSKSDLSESNDFNSVNLPEPVSPSSVMKLNTSKLDLKEILLNSKMIFPEIQSSSLTNTMFPLSFTKKLYSTKTAYLMPSKALTEDLSPGSQILKTFTESPSPKVVTLTIRRTASSSTTRSKCNPNYDFPYLSKLFGIKDLLMSCDAYNQALVEAAKRRAALAECTALSKQLKKDVNSRPQVLSIKGCSAPKQEALQKLPSAIKTYSPCPPPQKIKMQASGDGCKKDDPCKAPECPNPCKDEMEKLQHQADKEIQKKNKMPTGCESPKCKKDDSCTKFRKSPCKKATNQPTSEDFKCSSKSSSDVKQMKDNCKKDDPCKSPECPNPCKDEMEKMKRQSDEDMKSKRNTTTSGCVSPKCRKDDACTKRKENPCKKAQAPGDTLKCDKKGDSNKGKSDSCGKSKDKVQKNPCLDEHTEYKPKCNIDPCKKDGSPCGGAKKTPAGPAATKKADSCGCGKKDQKKEDPCKKKDPCGGNKQKEDPCKKKDKSPCGGKKEDPCQKRKSSPCGSRKDDPCKKKKDGPCGGKKDDPCKKQKEDPCKKKKEDPCGSKKDDPCKKPKEDPCKKKKDDPCGGQKDDPCKKPKEDPCKKKKESPCKKDKDDPCKKKSTSPCASGKKKPTSPCKPKKDSKSSKNQVCGKQKRETKPNCGQNKKCFSTSIAGPYRSSNSLTKRTSSPFPYRFGFMRYYSSKSDGNNKESDDLGRASQCKSVSTNVPPKRKPSYNPHPKDGLRKCYPTYDMDCTKFCKDARKTDCRKYAFLKDTDNNKRNGKK